MCKTNHSQSLVKKATTPPTTITTVAAQLYFDASEPRRTNDRGWIDKY